MSYRTVFGWIAISALTLSIAACQAKKAEHATDAKPAVAAAGHSHEGWWCDEHGVPEEECAQCHAKLVAGFKAKSDWCEKHNRPDSQCFICHPEKEAEYAALYEAKYGKKPPKPEVDVAETESQAKS
jgi:hypothetical protein